jgi:hypothetical protein
VQHALYTHVHTNAINPELKNNDCTYELSSLDTLIPNIIPSP